jgi:Nucleotidyl transferase AbiEii toxin, Type IV TA system
MAVRRKHDEESNITRPTKATVGGRAFLALQRQARAAGRTTAEYLRLYALEGFLLRLAHSSHRNSLVLKGGMLLAAYELRRPTADVDLAALQTSNEVDEVRQLITEVAATVLPAELDDGLTFDLTNVTAEAIRDEGEYSGVRVRLLARLATAREPFHADVNIGDPIWPAPAIEISLPRLLEQEPIQLRGYPIEMVLAEKIVTALERGPASTRWRDFGDIYLVTGRYSFQAGEVRQALRSVADHRRVELVGLDDAFDGYAEIGQPRWTAWRNKLELTETLPLDFGEALDSLRAFANPILTSSASDTANWDPVQRGWRPVVTGVTTKAAAAVTAASAAQSSALVR